MVQHTWSKQKVKGTGRISKKWKQKKTFSNMTSCTFVIIYMISHCQMNRVIKMQTNDIKAVSAIQHENVYIFHFCE